MMLKSPREIELMARAGKVVKEALDAVKAVVRPGISTLELSAVAEDVILSRGAVPSFKGYQGFPAAICVSVNREVVHGIPSKKRHLHEGDIVSVDIGAFLEGYHGDGARTYAVGTIDPTAQKLIDITKECFFKGLEQAREGGRMGDISYAIQAHAEANGFSVVRELIGHGIGQKIHEPPDVPNFGKAGRGTRLLQGLTIAVEPMINMGERNVVTLPDGWTVVTLDGQYSAHYENTIAIAGAEALILTA